MASLPNPQAAYSKGFDDRYVKSKEASSILKVGFGVSVTGNRQIQSVHGDRE